MSLLYKPEEKQVITCQVSEKDNKFVLDFWMDCGKHGASEIIDGYTLTAERLLEVLQSYDNYTDEEV